MKEITDYSYNEIKNIIEFSDFRSKNILSAISKILEKIIVQQLIGLKQYTQSGFRAGYRYTTALLNVVDDIIL